MLNYLGSSNSVYPSLFTTLDQMGKNAILYALETGICIEIMSGYIFSLNLRNKICSKFVMEAELMQKVKHALMYPISEIHPKLLIQDLIGPLYTEKSVEELTNLIGQDWLDSYYI
jgi:hypothetical protein